MCLFSLFLFFQVLHASPLPFYQNENKNMIYLVKMTVTSFFFFFFFVQVLRAGLLCEFDEPHVLLSDSSSYLHRLVEHTGVDAANKLKEMALTAYNKRRKVSE